MEEEDADEGSDCGEDSPRNQRTMGNCDVDCVRSNESLFGEDCLRCGVLFDELLFSEVCERDAVVVVAARWACVRHIRSSSVLEREEQSASRDNLGLASVIKLCSLSESGVRGRERDVESMLLVQ